MDLGDFFDIGEALHVFLRPWLFLFSRTYRTACLEAWREASWGRRLGFALEAAISIAFGVVLPAMLTLGLISSVL